jgi:tetratricopeptide (TPR) repeat protein/SAM-dependent methyltransferase
MDARFASAVKCMQAGQLAEAERLCGAILAAAPNDVPAIHLLGFVAYKAGRPQEAIDLIGKAIALDETNADCHFNIGLALLAAGRVAEASGHFARATALKPAYATGVDDLVNLVYGRANEALGQGQIEAAVAGFRQVTALKPGFAEAYSNLGVALMAQGRAVDAAAAYRQAIAINPKLVTTYRNLGRCLVAQGEVLGAVELARRALEIAPTDDIKTFFMLAVRSLPLTAATDPAVADIRPLLARALAEGWGRPADLAVFAAELIKARPSRDDGLLLAHLESTPVRDIALERWVTGERRRLLMHGTDDNLVFACALARQCFINEYVFAEEEDETRRAAALRDAVAAGDACTPLQVAIVAAYFPLQGLPNNCALLHRDWPEPVRGVLVQQVRQPLEEAADRPRIPVLTPISDTISRAVRDQYEQMPYPRWAKAPLPEPPMPIDQYMRGRFRLATLRPLGRTGRLDMLVAGCGTGEHPIGAARRYTGAQVLAVDLSLSSLAYARRITRELGIANIEYAQADILELGTIERRFDVIEAAGVLHHLADPSAGWRVLLSLLRPNGLMFIGLYSRRARQAVRLAREFIAQRRIGTSAADIRRCRQELLALDDDDPLKEITRFGDFHTISNCRDLLFHVQEHQFDIPDIRAFLAASGLTFIGFLLDPAVQQQYRQRFPHDPALTDLDGWDAFEADNPLTFTGMYQFWVQKQ